MKAQKTQFVCRECGAVSITWKGKCTECGAALEPIGKEFVRHEFRFTPAKGEVINIYRETYKCPQCSTANAMAENIKFVKAHVPDALIPNSYASETVVAWVMYQKFANAMPLYRQEMDWKQLGVSFTRATLANWIIYCAGHYFQPMYDYFHRQLLQRKYLMADELCEASHNSSYEKLYIM